MMQVLPPAITTTWPSICQPWPYPDPELDRLRRMQERQRVEEEKEAIRQWLRRHGVPEYQISPAPFVPTPCLPMHPTCPRPAFPSVGDVLRRIG